MTRKRVKHLPIIQQKIYSALFLNLNCNPITANKAPRDKLVLCVHCTLYNRNCFSMESYNTATVLASPFIEKFQTHESLFFSRRHFEQGHYFGLIYPVDRLSFFHLFLPKLLHWLFFFWGFLPQIYRIESIFSRD